MYNELKPLVGPTRDCATRRLRWPWRWLLLFLSPLTGTAAPVLPADCCNRAAAKYWACDYAAAIAEANRALELNRKLTAASRNLAVIARRSGNNAAALIDLDRALKADPKSAETYFERARLKFAKFDFDGALRDDDRAVELSSFNATYYAHRGLAELAKGEAEAAMPDFDEAIQKGPRYAFPYLKRGDAHLMLQEWSKARQDYLRYAELPGLDGAQARSLWAARQRLGEKEEADLELALYVDERYGAAPTGWTTAVAEYDLGRISESELLAAAGLGSSVNELERQCEAWYGIGLKRLLVHDVDAAIDGFRKSLATGRRDQPGYWFARAELETVSDYGAAIAKQQEGDLDGAIALLDHWINSNPKDSNAFFERGEARRLKGDCAEAMADYDRALGLKPTAAAWKSRAELEMQQGRLTEALAGFDHALALNPAWIDVYLERARLRQTVSRPSDALADYNKVVELSPTDPEAHVQRGLFKSLSGDSEGAKVDLRRALDLNPKLPAIHFDRAKAKLEKYDFAGASEEDSLALAVDPALLDAQLHRARAKLGEGDGAAALLDLDIVLEQRPNDAMAWRDRGHAHVLNREWPAAINDYRKADEIGGKDLELSRLYIWMLRRRLGEQEPADQDLAAYAEAHLPGNDSAWLSKVADYCLGRLAESALLTAAEDEKPRVNFMRHCHAWYFIGIMKLLEGDQSAAAEAFRKSVETNEQQLTTLRFARAELKSLAK